MKFTDRAMVLNNHDSFGFNLLNTYILLQSAGDLCRAAESEAAREAGPRGAGDDATPAEDA